MWSLKTRELNSSDVELISDTIHTNSITYLIIESTKTRDPTLQRSEYGKLKKLKDKKDMSFMTCIIGFDSMVTSGVDALTELLKTN
jgi:hypothetical protein